MKEEYTLQEAADILGWHYDKLKTMKRRSQLAVIQIPYGAQRFRDGITLATLLDLQKQDEKKDAYHELTKRMFAEMRSGAWSGRPMTDKWVDTLEEYLERYWKILGVSPSILGVNVENFKTVMGSFIVDRQKKQDFHSTKMHIYKAVTALMKLLIAEGYKRPVDLEEIRQKRPGKVVDKKRGVLDLVDIQTCLQVNQIWMSGLPGDLVIYERRAFQALFCLYAYGGLRKMEAANLRLDQLFLEKGYMHVYGKWAKERIVPIFPILMDQLTYWLEAREKWFKRSGVTSNLVVPQNDGKILKEKAIDSKFQRFRGYVKEKHPDIQLPSQLSPHPLRRSCATIAALNGMPDALIQQMLGHEDPGTTQGYKMIQDRHLIEYAQNFNFGLPAVPAKIPVHFSRKEEPAREELIIQIQAPTYSFI